MNFENLSIFKLTHNTFPRMNKLNANSDANDLNTRCNLLSSRQRFFNAVQSLWLFQTLFQTWFNWLKVIASMWWYMCHFRFCQVLYRWAYFIFRGKVGSIVQYICFMKQKNHQSITQKDTKWRNMWGKKKRWKMWLLTCLC